MRSFVQDTCGCTLNEGNPCSNNFTEQYYNLYRMDCATLTKCELDMLIKGHLESHIGDSHLTSNALNHRHFPEERQLVSMTFHHHGIRICRKTYMFLHTIGKKRYNNLKASVKTDGVLPRQHGNLRRVPKHAFELDDTQAVITFITNYTEEHGIHLPGFKQTDIQLLPCHTTKKQFGDSIVMLSQICLLMNQLGKQGIAPFYTSGKINFQTSTAKTVRLNGKNGVPWNNFLRLLHGSCIPRRVNNRCSITRN